MIKIIRNIMRKYVSDVINVHYLIGACGSEKDLFIQNDQAVQALYRELSRSELAGIRVGHISDVFFIHFLCFRECQNLIQKKT